MRKERFPFLKVDDFFYYEKERINKFRKFSKGKREQGEIARCVPWVEEYPSGLAQAP
jgi:hypothetical protein